MNSISSMSKQHSNDCQTPMKYWRSAHLHTDCCRAKVQNSHNLDICPQKGNIASGTSPDKSAYRYTTEPWGQGHSSQSTKSVSQEKYTHSSVCPGLVFSRHDKKNPGWKQVCWRGRKKRHFGKHLVVHQNTVGDRIHIYAWTNTRDMHSPSHKCSALWIYTPA